MEPEELDVVVVGAGLSGINAAVHIRQRHPTKTLAILERRSATGGTWDLFRYPGIRSDSDMFTLGYPFRPWESPKGIADGPSILEYIRSTAREFDVERLVRLNHSVDRASWSSRTARWTLTLSDGEGNALREVQTRFLVFCTGYYRYDAGYTPDFEGMDQFSGQVIHPQKWPDDADWTGKRVVVIGSGATAVTLVPALADKAEHVVMLQRSPTYIAAAPSEDAIASWLQERLPAETAYAAARWKNISYSMFTYWYCRTFPEKARATILDEVKKAVGPEIDCETHFNPSYDPWDQRLCLAADGDFFEALKDGSASVMTDHIERFVAEGIRLRSGAVVEADWVITATGLRLQALGGMALEVDGEVVAMQDLTAYRGILFSDVPNAAMLLGYTNASWTLKSDLSAEYVCRVLAHMDAGGYDIAVPRREPGGDRVPIIDFSSGYVKRAMDQLPHQGSRPPWRLYQNYLLDLLMLRYTPLRDGAMQFERVGEPRRRSLASRALGRLRRRGV